MAQSVLTIFSISGLGDMMVFKKCKIWNERWLKQIFGGITILKSIDLFAFSSQREDMFRRSLGALAKQGGRTLVRDPRKSSSNKRLLEAVGSSPEQPQPPVAHQSNNPPRPLLPFEPSQQNQESLGSSLVSYALAGVGVTLGVILVRVVLGF